VGVQRDLPHLPGRRRRLHGGAASQALLGVVGRLLLFADYTITASLSAVEAFHYFGLGAMHSAHVQKEQDAGD
jgi:hypothetical protein